MREIYAALNHGGKTMPVGVLRFDVKQSFGYFVYLPKYDGPPLDPVNLDYRKPVDPKDKLRRGERVFLVDPQLCPDLMHQVFVDAMPGQWGMAVLQAEYPEIRQMKRCEQLYWMGSRTVGALSLFVSRLEDERPVKGFDELEVVRAKCAEFMAKLEKMGLEGVRNPAVASHGGVMPKASYEDAQGRHWLAKFDRPGDGIQFCVLEHAASTMARRCGIATPETRALADGQGGHIYLSERYDRGVGGRNHKASMMTLTNAKEAGTGDYRDMFRTLKDVCDPVAWPAQRDELLRRMAFNIGLNVTDDHLRNHEVCLTASGSWELTPAYDLVPVSGPSPHQCAVFGQPRASINLKDKGAGAFWAKVAAEIGATPEHVAGVVGKVAATIEAEWPTLVESVGLNRFNQMAALMAAEVGCNVPFPERARNPDPVPLTSQILHQLRSAESTVSRAYGILSGSLAATESNAVARELRGLHADIPKLSHSLRLAGMSDLAEVLHSASVLSASQSVLDGRSPHIEMWRDLWDAQSALQSAVEIAAAKTSKQQRPGPARAAPN